MLRNLTRDTVIARNVELADTFLRRLRGLLFRTGLPEDGALILDETGSIHMIGMLFSIDVVFLDRERRVLATFPRRRPFSFPVWAWGAHYAVELPVGRIAQATIQPGDQLEW